MTTKSRSKSKPNRCPWCLPSQPQVDPYTQVNQTLKSTPTPKSMAPHKLTTTRKSMLNLKSSQIKLKPKGKSRSTFDLRWRGDFPTNRPLLPLFLGIPTKDKKSLLRRKESLPRWKKRWSFLPSKRFSLKSNFLSLSKTPLRLRPSLSETRKTFEDPE